MVAAKAASARRTAFIGGLVEGKEVVRVKQAKIAVAASGSLTGSLNASVIAECDAERAGGREKRTFHSECSAPFK